MEKRIYIVIECGHFDAIPQGAFETETAAWDALNEWKSRSGGNSTWIVRSTTLHKS